MSEKDVVENVNSPGAVSIPIASNSAKGIASFNAKDFTVNNGEVSAIWERGVPQYVGTIVGQEEGEGDLTWTIDDTSLIDNRPVKIGEYIMLRENAFGFARGEVFVITGISADENFLATTDNQSVFSLQGEVGPKGDKGDKGDKGEQGKEGVGIADITNIDYPHGEFENVRYDNTDGIKMQGIAEYLRNDGETYQIPIDIDIPIIAGAGVSIDKKENEEKVEIKSLNSNLENGTGDVLIQTTDTNHSFKAMTDGRAKVQSAPVENDDVLRLNEFADLTKEVADRYVAKVTLKYRVIRDITLEEDTKEVYITTDENGNTFKLKSVFVMYYGKFTSVNVPQLYLRFNGGNIYQMYYNMKNTSISTEQYYRHWIKSDRYGSTNSGETIWQSIFANKLLIGSGQGIYDDNADLASDLTFTYVRTSVTEIGYANTTKNNNFATGSRIIFWGIDDDE